MKELTKKKLLSAISTIFRIISVLAVIAVAFEIVLYFIGFRFVYPAKFSNDWNAISGVAAWASVVASLIAVWAAVQIPKKIADQQNSISLINYRLEIKRTITEIADYIECLSTFPKVDMNTVKAPEELSPIFSFATLPESRKKREIIGDYPLYFTNYCSCVERFSKIYHQIAWDYLQVEIAKEKIPKLNKLAETIKEANDFITSEEFCAFKKYMDETMKVSN